MAQLDVFDVFDALTTVGRHRLLGPGGPHTVEDLLRDMDHFGVREALVLDCLSAESHPAEGNPRIIEAIANQPRLHPAWTALPSGTDEQPDPSELVQRMERSGVGALFLFTGVYKMSLADWSIDDLLAPLAERGAPVFIRANDYDEHGWDMTPWDDVVALCRRWPTLPVVVTETRMRRSQRIIYRALEECENLRIELSGYWLSRGIEYITSRFGAERLIFGSNWPHYGYGQTLAMLTCSEIEPDDKQRIAGGNLRELLSWSVPAAPTEAPPAPADELVRLGQTGEAPDGFRVHDCHGHLGGHMSHYHVPDGDLDSTVREMDRFGVERCVVFSMAGVVSDECYGNDLVADALRRYPDRFVGLCLLNPHRGREEMLAELGRCADLGFRGIKLIAHYQGYPNEGPLIDVACEWVHEHRQIILNHDWGSVGQVERLTREYDQACFFTGHMSTAYAEVMRSAPNLYVCSCPLIPPGECERVVAEIGADRLLFGSDLLDLPIAWGLGPILFARLPVEDRMKVLGGNLEGILRRYSRTA
jgi:predicted TIM-barrel fold metal-dependent hydrolase